MCKICERFWGEFHKRLDDWEREQSNDNDLLAEDSEELWLLIQQGSAAGDSDPADAFQFYSAAAEAGSVWATEAIAWYHWTGTGVATDLQLAQHYYRRAIAGGSQMAIIRHAQLLRALDQPDAAEQVLENGLASGFIPAAYWLARYRMYRSNTRAMAKQVRPLLEQAAVQGHPDAAMLIALLKAKGKFGVGKIPGGIRQIVREAITYARDSD